MKFLTKLSGTTALIISGVLAFAVMSQTAKADDTDPLHGVCIPGCSANNSNSPTSTNPPTFGFTVSPGPATGNLVLVFLVPTNGTIPVSIGFTGTSNGASDGTAMLFSPTAWTSGQLDSYLGISASPTNGINAFNDITNPKIPGFDVYTADVGTFTLPKQANPDDSPYWTVTGGLPIDTYIVGFFNEGTANDPDWVATANSGAILETDPPPSAVPEPSSLFLLGTGVLGFAGVVRRRFGR